MSQIPPNPGQGWIDANGYQQPGFPPPGFWQASDGRWYPPESADPSQFATQQVQPGQFPQQQGPPQQGPPQVPPQQQFPHQGQPQQFQAQPVQQQPRKTSRTGLWIVLGVIAALVAGCGAIVIVGVVQVANETADFLETTTTAPSASDDSPVADEGTTTTAESDSFGGLGGDDGAADIIRCTKFDDETLELEVVNSSSETANYFLTIAFFDDSGQRVSDTSGFVTALRPGERTIEEVFIFDEPGTSCEVIDAERLASEITPGSLTDISACEVTGADFVDDVAATVSATNSASTSSDYSIDVAILDGDGVRRGTGFSFIETVRPGETAPSEIFTTVDFADDVTCEVIAVLRTPS